MAEQHVGAVTSFTKIVDVTLSLNTSAYADGDLLADVQEIPNVFRESGGTGVLHSIQLVDLSDQGVALDLFFTDLSTTWGTENAALTGTDALADDVQAVVQVAATDYVDLIDCQIVSKGNLGMVVQAPSDSTSLYVAAASRGAGTYAAAGIVLKLGFFLD